MIKLILASAFCLALISCSENSTDLIKNENDSLLKMTFIELGSINCIPCQRMQPVMDSIRKKYGYQIKVEFIDVLRDKDKAAPYKIKAMPTQVFLDRDNIEIHRHMGFYSEDSIHIFLQSKGLKILG